MKPGQLAAKTHATRAAIVSFVAGNPRSNQTDIALAVKLTRPTVVKHLLALVQAGAIVNQFGKYYAV